MKKLSKLVAVVIAAAMAVVMCIVPAGAESIFTSATSIESGKSYAVNFSEKNKTCNRKIKVSKSGTMKISVTSYDMRLVVFHVYDQDGKEVEYDEKDQKTGSYDANTTFSHKLLWNESTESCKVNLTYTVKPGTYYIQLLQREGYGKCVYNVTTPGGSSSSSVSSSSSNATIKITMDEGDKISLGALVSGKEKEVKWTSSKKSVAKVSSKGRVSAESEGTATLTAKSGGKVIATVVIEVE